MEIETVARRPLGSRVTAYVAATIMVLVSVFGVSSTASASEMTPVITFDGNVLANEPIAFEFGQRIEIFQLPLETLPLTRVRTTSRAGYSFGGWSYQPGGSATETLSSSSYTSSRVFLYAVWNTKINLDTNGATSGRLLSGESTLDYRFGQNLTLPTGGTIKKRGYSFAGWTLAQDSGVIARTYRAADDASGNPTVYAAWTKTINFRSRGSTGIVPASISYPEGAARISLPTLSQTSLTRPGFDFMGWSTSPRGKVVKNPSSYLPKKASVTLHAVWKRAR